MAVDEKSVSEAGNDHVEHKHESTRDPLATLAQTHTKSDVIHATQERPYASINFIGTYAAATLACVGCFGTYIMPVTALTIINAEIGPSPNATWVALAWTLLSAVSFVLLGRLSDIFGRRFFFIGSSASALIGSIIGCTANRIETLIAASVFLGLASAGQLSINYTIGELVPIRDRFAANGLIYLFTLPTSAFGPYIARLFIVETSANWRGIYYLGIGFHGLATICWVLFYHPPRFQSLHSGRTKAQELRDLDFGGIFLFLAGAVLFLLGLSWGGQLYPWKSAQVLCTLVIGFVVLVAFVLYEVLAPLRRPLIPMHLFNYGFSAFNILSAVGGVVYYSMAVLFPTMVATLFEMDALKGGLVSCATGGGVCAGQFIGSWIAVPGGRLKLKLIFISAGMTGFVAALAGATNSEKTATACAVMAGFFVGLLEVIVSTAITVVIEDQSELGAGAGVFGSIRAAAGVLATAIYASVLGNKITSYTKSIVAPALLQAGLPPKSLMPLIEAISASQLEAAEKIPGVNPKILQVAAASFREAFARSFKIVFLATLAFGGLSVIAAFFAPDIDDQLTNVVVRQLGKQYDNEPEGKDVEDV